MENRISPLPSRITVTNRCEPNNHPTDFTIWAGPHTQSQAQATRQSQTPEHRHRSQGGEGLFVRATTVANVQISSADLNDKPTREHHRKRSGKESLAWPMMYLSSARARSEHRNPSFERQSVSMISSNTRKRRLGWGERGERLSISTETLPKNQKKPMAKSRGRRVALQNELRLRKKSGARRRPSANNFQWHWPMCQSQARPAQRLSTEFGTR